MPVAARALLQAALLVPSALAIVRRRACARARRRSWTRGFSLIELMVVIILVSILAVIAVPSLGPAREERLTFELADSFGRLVKTARTRAMARGAAHLVAITSAGTTDRGTFLAFESRDAAGRPLASCRTPASWTVPAGSATSPLVDGLRLSGTDMKAQMGLETSLSVDGVTAAAAVLCFTPGGRIYLATGSTPQVAANTLPVATPTTSTLAVRFARMQGGSAVGIQRTIVVPPSGAPRLRAE